MHTPDLFSTVPSPSPRQRVTGDRDRLLTRLAAKQRADFMAKACAFVVRYLAQHGPTSGEALTLACRAAGIVPAGDDRAFGPVYMALVKQGAIEKCGSCRRERGRGTAGGNIWRAVETR